MSWGYIFVNLGACEIMYLYFILPHMTVFASTGVIAKQDSPASHSGSVTPTNEPADDESLTPLSVSHTHSH